MAQPYYNFYQIPDIDIKIQESELKMKGEYTMLQDRIEKLEMDMKLCCPKKRMAAARSAARAAAAEVLHREGVGRVLGHEEFQQLATAAASSPRRHATTDEKIVKIESRAGDFIDRIELHLKDGSVKKYGGEGGTPMDSFILGKDEKITKILKYGAPASASASPPEPVLKVSKKAAIARDRRSQRTAALDKFLGKRIDIITNLNRIYKIAGVFCKAPCNPREDLTYEGEPIVEFNISPNKELIGLNFDKGELIGIEETELEGGYSKKKTKRKSKRKKRKSKRKKRKSKKKTKRKNN